MPQMINLSPKHPTPFLIIDQFSYNDVNDSAQASKGSLVYFLFDRTNVLL